MSETIGGKDSVSSATGANTGLNSSLVGSSLLSTSRIDSISDNKGVFTFKGRVGKSGNFGVGRLTKPDKEGRGGSVENKLPTTDIGKELKLSLEEGAGKGTRLLGDSFLVPCN